MADKTDSFSASAGNGDIYRIEEFTDYCPGTKEVFKKWYLTDRGANVTKPKDSEELYVIHLTEQNKVIVNRM